MSRNRITGHRVTAAIAAVLSGMLLSPAAVAQTAPRGTQTECEPNLQGEFPSEQGEFQFGQGDFQFEQCPSQTSSSTQEQFFGFVSNLGTRISQQRHLVRGGDRGSEEGPDSTAGLTRGGAAGADSDETGITAYGRLSAFGVADYSASDREATGKGDAYDQHNEAVVLGLDYRFSNTLFAGATFNYLAGDTDFTGATGPTGSTEVDSYIFGLHGSKYWGDVYLEALVTYGRFDLDIDRIDFFGDRYGASPDGDLRSADLSLGYVHSRNRWRTTPAVKLLYLDGSIDGYTETTSAGFGSPKTFEEQDFEALNAELSVQFDYVVLKNWGVLIPSLKLAYNHEFEDPHTVRGVQFGEFAEEPEAPDADTATVRLGVSAQFKRGWSAFASFEKLLEHSYIDRNNIAAGVRYEFF